MTFRSKRARKRDSVADRASKSPQPTTAHDLDTSAELGIRLENCRMRLQSVELLAASSRRDGLLLAYALLDDVSALLNRSQPPGGPLSGRDANHVVCELPGATARAQLLTTRNALVAGQSDGVSDEAIVALRALLVSVSRAPGGKTGWRGAVLATLSRRRRGLAAAAAVLLLTAGAGAYYRDASKHEAGVEFDRLFSLAEDELRAGKHDAAVESFRSALALAPENPRASSAWNDMAWSLQQLGRHGEAIAGYEKALASKPGFTLARNNLDALNQRLKAKAK